MAGTRLIGASERFRALPDVLIALLVIGIVIAASLGARIYEESLAQSRGAIDLSGEVTAVGPDGQAIGGWSRKEIRVRPGEKVTIRLSSQDVTHGFLIPELEVQSHPIEPGKFETVEFTAPKSGVYLYYCNALCGHRHGAMIGRLIVEENGGAS